MTNGNEGTNLHCCDELGESEVPLPLGIRDRPYLRTQIPKQLKVVSHSSTIILDDITREEQEETSGPVLTCLRSARESADKPKKLVASAPVTRPSPSATETPAGAVSIKPQRIFWGGVEAEGRKRLTWVCEGEPVGVDPLVLLGAGHASSRSRDLHLRPLSPPRPGARPPPPPPPQRRAGATAAAQMRQEPDGPPRTRFGFPSRLRWIGWHFETEDPTARRRSP